jgi:hypothetical protein
MVFGRGTLCTFASYSASIIDKGDLTMSEQKQNKQENQQQQNPSAKPKQPGPNAEPGHQKQDIHQESANQGNRNTGMSINP